MKHSFSGFALASAAVLSLTGCSVDEIKKTLNLQPREQKVLRVWRGNQYDTKSKGVCGIFTNPSEINRMQSQGWSIKSSNPINYRINQRFYYYDCFGSEVVLEK